MILLIFKKTFIRYLRTLGEFDMGRSTRAARDSLRLLHRWLVYRRNRSVLATRKQSHASLQTAFSRRFVFRVQADACILWSLCVYNVYVCVYVCVLSGDSCKMACTPWENTGNVVHTRAKGEKKWKDRGKGIHRLRKYRQKMNVREKEREREK